MSSNRNFRHSKCSEIASRYNSGEGLLELAAEYGISKQRVYEIVRREGPVRPRKITVRAGISIDLEVARELWLLGLRKGEIASRLKVPVETLSRQWRAAGYSWSYRGTGYRRCASCGLVKLLSDFGRDASDPELRSRRCRPCARAHGARMYGKRKERRDA